MLYNLKIPQKETPTDTYIFGTRCLLTLGIEVLGKKLDSYIFQPFSSIDELITFKNSMKKPPRGNVPILINKQGNTIKISARLIKSKSLSHDPNIGASSLISATLRKLGWKGRIIITNHGLKQHHLTPDNKFIKIANILNVEIEDLKVPKAIKNKGYWEYETKREKLATIFVHIIVENFTDGSAIFENHGGCEKGYFIAKEYKSIPIEKYSNRNAYKKGDKSKIINIPDLILIDFKRSEIINIEGKKYEFRKKGIEKLKKFEEIEKKYIKKYYPEYKIIRNVVLYGSHERKIVETEVSFLLNKDGDLVLGTKSPELFKDAIKNLIDFWFS